MEITSPRFVMGISVSMIIFIMTTTMFAFTIYSWLDGKMEKDVIKILDNIKILLECWDCRVTTKGTSTHRHESTTEPVEVMNKWNLSSFNH